jgi:Ca2+-binding EF-hand superfamily protein
MLIFVFSNKDKNLKHFNFRFVFNAIDTNKNGTIDFNEYIIAMTTQCSGSLVDRLNWMFNIYDLDGSDSLEKSEIVTIISSLYQYLGRDNTQHRGSIGNERINKLFNKV